MLTTRFSHQYSQGICDCLKLLTGPGTSTRPGVMIPIPQYPLYSASLTEYNMDQVWWLVFLVIRWIMSSLRLDTIWMSQGTGPWMLLSWRELTKQPRTSLTSRPLKWQPQGAGPHQGQLGGCHQVCCWEEAVCLCWWGESLFVFLSLLTEVSLPG